MKTKLLSIFLVILAILSSCNDPQEEIIEPVKFSFPDGWQSITNHEEKIAALQIPENLLSKISTENLVEACMTYPLGPECFFFNDYQFGLARIIENFNGFAELKKHNDAFDKILDHYSKELDKIVRKVYDNETLTTEPLQLFYVEQFIISGYLYPVDQLKDSQKLISLYPIAKKLRESSEKFQSHSSINTLNAMKKVLGLE
ncbi:MAG: hypothetical protein K2M25_02275 [Muribaculaceae bacterium]|nr:hypothetical protein [Muribaculaceae bacterium]MDE6224946.1 hypothetical protein [Muribaculaceae bacterium]